MNINASIIDQQITGVLEKHPDWFPDRDENKNRATAFVLLCMKNLLDLDLEECPELLTDGGNDAGVDGLHVGELTDGDLPVTLFQGKYKVTNLEGTANFPETEVQKAVSTVQALFDPKRELSLNDKIKHRVEEVRSLIRDGEIPQVRFVLCNNGKRWHQQAQGWIDSLPAHLASQVEFVHFNHDSIVEILSRTRPVTVRLQLSGSVAVDDMGYIRVLLGKVSVRQIAELFEQYGNLVLQRNIRRYLGLHNNQINQAMYETLCSDQPENFYFYNNGITVVCDRFDYNALQATDPTLLLKNMQIINGGQTCKTIYETMKGLRENGPGAWSEQVHGDAAEAQELAAMLRQEQIGATAQVMLRVYQLPGENQQLPDVYRQFVNAVTYATNNQNPVDLRDLRSDDKVQQQLELGMKELGYTYRRKREVNGNGAKVVTSWVTAEAVLAIWREQPHQAKFKRKEHFGKLYERIFNGLNAAQALLAVLIFREVENARKRATGQLIAGPAEPPAGEQPAPAAPEFLPYASHYLAMIVGTLLLMNIGGDPSGIPLPVKDISHRNFPRLAELFQQNKQDYHQTAISLIEDALFDLYGDNYGAGKVSLQQLSATFRRGDLLTRLPTQATPLTSN